MAMWNQLNFPSHLDSKYRDLISDSILKLQETQKLHELYDRWWKQRGGAGQCDNDDKGKKDANALAIANVGGIFVVLVTGLGLSLIVAVLEFVWKAHKNADEGKVRVRQTFSCFCFNSLQRVHLEEIQGSKTASKSNLPSSFCVVRVFCCLLSTW